MPNSLFLSKIVFSEMDVEVLLKLPVFQQKVTKYITFMIYSTAIYEICQLQIPNTWGYNLSLNLCPNLYAQNGDHIIRFNVQ